METSTKRDTTFDIAKGISILIMTISHLELFRDYPTLFDFNDDVLKLFKMPLFIFISGILFSQRLDWKEFMKLKFDALLKPAITLFTITFLSLMAWYILNGAAYNVHNFKAFFIQTTNLYFPLWFPINLFFSLCLFRFLKHLHQNYSPRMFIIGFMSSLFVLVLSTQLSLGFHLIKLHTWLFFLIILYIGDEFKQKKWVDILTSKVFFGFSLLLFSVSIYFKDVLDIELDLYLNKFGRTIPTALTFLSGISIVLFLSKQLKQLPYIATVLRWCAQSSLFILAFHILFANHLLNPYLREHIELQWFADTLTFVLTILICVSMYWIVKQTHYIKYFMLPIKSFK